MKKLIAIAATTLLLTSCGGISGVATGGPDIDFNADVEAIGLGIKKFEANSSTSGTVKTLEDFRILTENNAAILDFKQTNKPKKGEWVEDYFLQLTAYALAHNEVHGTDIKHGHIFMCSRNLEYQQFDLSPEPDPYFKRTFEDWCKVWWDRVYTYYEKYA